MKRYFTLSFFVLLLFVSLSGVLAQDAEITPDVQPTLEASPVVVTEPATATTIPTATSTATVAPTLTPTALPEITEQVAPTATHTATAQPTLAPEVTPAAESTVASDSSSVIPEITPEAENTAEAIFPELTAEVITPEIVPTEFVIPASTPMPAVLNAEQLSGVTANSVSATGELPPATYCYADNETEFNACMVDAKSTTDPYVIWLTSDNEYVNIRMGIINNPNKIVIASSDPGTRRIIRATLPGRFATVNNPLAIILLVDVEIHDYVNISNNIPYAGGAIHNTGNLRLKNVVFENNEGSNGGAIASAHGNLLIWNAEFRNNISSGGGGAISNETDNRLVAQCVSFFNNTAYGGGAVWTVQTYELSITYSNFSGNTSTIGGANILNDTDSVNATNNYWGSPLGPGGSNSGTVATTPHETASIDILADPECDGSDPAHPIPEELNIPPEEGNICPGAASLNGAAVMQFNNNNGDECPTQDYCEAVVGEANTWEVQLIDSADVSIANEAIDMKAVADASGLIIHDGPTWNARRLDYDAGAGTDDPIFKPADNSATPIPIPWGTSVKVDRFIELPNGEVWYRLAGEVEESATHYENGQAITEQTQNDAWIAAYGGEEGLVYTDVNDVVEPCGAGGLSLIKKWV